MVEIACLPTSCSAADITFTCERDGGVIVQGWLTADLVTRLNAELEGWLARHAGTDSGSADSDVFLGLNTRRLQGLVNKAPGFVEVMLDARLLDFAEAVLGPISPNLLLNNGEVIDIGPGEAAQPFHRDDDAWNFANASAPLVVNTIAALTEITPELGGTMVVPGSHRWDRQRQPQPAEICACTLAPGDALFFRGDVLHAGGANRTPDRRRRALSTALCCGWLRPVENSYTNVPLATVRRLPVRARELLGYALYDASAVGGGYLGYHDMGDPMRLVDPQASD